MTARQIQQLHQAAADAIAAVRPQHVTIADPQTTRLALAIATDWLTHDLKPEARGISAEKATDLVLDVTCW